MKLDVLEHSSGAVKIPREYDFQAPYIWFSDCRCCKNGQIVVYNWQETDHTQHFRYRKGEMPQCQMCYSRYIRWLKDHQLIRYVIAVRNYPVRTKVDTTKGLIKSKGRIFYQEIDYHKAPEDVYVQAFAGDSQERLWIEGKYSHSFPTLCAAQQWICQQMGGTLRLFWFV